MPGSSASSSPTDNPWVVPVHDLVRHPGTQREIQDSWPAPEGMSNPLIGVPDASPIDVELRLEAVHEGVLATGTADAELVGECGRCLTPIEDEVSVELQELFLHHSQEDDEDERLVVQDTVDLEPSLRDAVVTALPFQPVCRADCPGLCSVCGIRLEDAPPGHAHEQLDPRWAALAALVEPNGPGESGDQNTTSTHETEER